MLSRHAHDVALGVQSTFLEMKGRQAHHTQSPWPPVDEDNFGIFETALGDVLLDRRLEFQAEIILEVSLDPLGDGSASYCSQGAQINSSSSAEGREPRRRARLGSFPSPRRGLHGGGRACDIEGS